MVATLCSTLEPRADAARPAAAGRLARHRHMAIGLARCRRCWRKATRTTGSARRSSCGCRRRRGVAGAVRLDRTDQRNVRCSICACCRGAISASARWPTSCSAFALYGSVYLLPLYLSRIQGYNSEQIGMVLAWTGLPQLVLIPLRAAADEARRRARLLVGARLRAVRRQLLHERPHDRRLCRRPAVRAEYRARGRPGPGAGAAVRHRDRRHRARERRLGLGACST